MAKKPTKKPKTRSPKKPSKVSTTDKLKGRVTKTFGKGAGAKQQRNVALLIVLVIAVPVISIFGGMALMQAIAPPSVGSEGAGYFTFQIVDTDTGLLLDGEVALINFETGALIDIYDTDEVIYTDISVVATIHSVDLDVSDTRVVLPSTIVPLVEGSLADPQTNTIGAYFYFPTANISVNIVEIDDVIGSYDESDIIADTLHELVLDIDVDRGSSNMSVYGASSWCPDLYLPTESDAQNITGFGLWFFLNGTDIDHNTVTVNTWETNSYYVTGGTYDYSIILLHPVFDGGMYQNQTVTVECETQPTEVGIFQGFIDDLDTTFIQIA